MPTHIQIQTPLQLKIQIQLQIQIQFFPIPGHLNECSSLLTMVGKIARIATTLQLPSTLILLLQQQLLPLFLAAQYLPNSLILPLTNALFKWFSSSLSLAALCTQLGLAHDDISESSHRSGISPICSLCRENQHSQSLKSNRWVD